MSNVPGHGQVASRELGRQPSEQVAEVHPALHDVRPKPAQVTSQRQQVKWIRDLWPHEFVKSIRNADLFEVLGERPGQSDREDPHVELFRPQPSQHASQHPFGSGQNDGVDDHSQSDSLVRQFTVPARQTFPGGL